MATPSSVTSARGRRGPGGIGSGSRRRPMGRIRRRAASAGGSLPTTGCGAIRRSRAAPRPGPAGSRPRRRPGPEHRTVDPRRCRRLCRRGPGGRRAGDGGHRHRPVVDGDAPGVARSSASRPPTPACVGRPPGGGHRVHGGLDPAVDGRPQDPRPAGPSSTTGLVVESGGIIVTPSQSLVRGQVDHRHRVGRDPPAGDPGRDRPDVRLAVLRIDDDLPAAIFDDRRPRRGRSAVAATLKPGRKAHPVPSSVVYAGRVVSSGQALGRRPGTTAFSSTAVDAPLARDDLGCPLVDDDGHVIGMLEMTEGNGKSAMAVFLPSELVLGVALQLVESGTVDHGWMGVQASDATTPTIPRRGGGLGIDGRRCRVVGRSRESGAVAGLEPGDVITAINGVPGPFGCRAPITPLCRPPGDRPGGDLRTRRGQRHASPWSWPTTDGDAPEDGSSP